MNEWMNERIYLYLTHQFLTHSTCSGLQPKCVYLYLVLADGDDNAVVPAAGDGGIQAWVPARPFHYVLDT